MRSRHVCLDCCSVGGFDTAERCAEAIKVMEEHAARVWAERSPARGQVAPVGEESD